MVDPGNLINMIKDRSIAASQKPEIGQYSGIFYNDSKRINMKRDHLKRN
jgi:hypothetical protein